MMAQLVEESAKGKKKLREACPKEKKVHRFPKGPNLKKKRGGDERRKTNRPWEAFVWLDKNHAHGGNWRSITGAGGCALRAGKSISSEKSPDKRDNEGCQCVCTLKHKRLGRREPSVTVQPLAGDTHRANSKKKGGRKRRD